MIPKKAYQKYLQKYSWNLKAKNEKNSRKKSKSLPILSGGVLSVWIMFWSISKICQISWCQCLFCLWVVTKIQYLWDNNVVFAVFIHFNEIAKIRNKYINYVESSADTFIMISVKWNIYAVYICMHEIKYQLATDVRLINIEQYNISWCNLKLILSLQVVLYILSSIVRFLICWIMTMMAPIAWLHFSISRQLYDTILMSSKAF